jgi:hypothetical protein
MATNRLDRWLSGLRAAGVTLGYAVLAGSAVAAANVPGDNAGTPAQWHAQKLDFTYTGFTAFYTCEGLESKVRFILLTLGARGDAKVRATGCVSDQPSKFAWVHTEFSSLAPAADGAAPKDTVQAAWSKVEISPRRPTEMGTGECELMDQMRPMIEKAFAMRNTAYRTTCVPKHISIADYSVHSEVLRLVSPIAN